jgi:threonine dehydratase
LLKCEHQQRTGSFKERGACHKLLCLNRAERAAGVVAASAGNHALGLAYHGQQLGIAVTVVMPRFAPLVKVNRCRSFGAEVKLVGQNFEEAQTHALELASGAGRVFVPGFDDAQVIQGQGTVALEAIEQAGELDAVLVPVGGGGLLSGIAVALKTLRPSIEVIGVESEAAPTLSSALIEGRPVPVQVKPSVADGLSVAQAGKLCLDLASRFVDRVERVTEPEIAMAIVRLMESEKFVVEGAGATGVAFALRRPGELRGRRVATIVSGGNIDLNVIARIIERGLVADGRRCRFAIEVDDHPGALVRVLQVLSGVEANVLQVHHDRYFGAHDIEKVVVTVVLETTDDAHIEQVRDALAAAGATYRSV